MNRNIIILLNKTVAQVQNLRYEQQQKIVINQATNKLIQDGLAVECFCYLTGLKASIVTEKTLNRELSNYVINQ